MAGYDAFYRRFVAAVPALRKVTGRFAMERVKSTTRCRFRRMAGFARGHGARSGAMPARPSGSPLPSPPSTGWARRCRRRRRRRRWLHHDIMDVIFVPKHLLRPGLVRALRRHAAIPFDVHLMIAPADPYLPPSRRPGRT
jgi:hypothetical protein